MRGTDLFAKAIQSDPEGAAVLMDLVAASIAEEEIAKHLSEIVDLYVEHTTPILNQAKIRLGRAYVSKASSGQYPGGELQATAKQLQDLEQWLVTVAKAGGYSWVNYKDEDSGAIRRQRVARDKLGRFARIAAGPAALANTNVDETAEEDIAPNVRRHLQAQGGVWTPNDPNQAERLNQVQGRFAQARQVASQWVQQLGPATAAEADVQINVRGRSTPYRIGLSELAQGALPEAMHSDLRQIEGIKLTPKAGAEDEVADTIARANASGMSRRLLSAVFGGTKGVKGTNLQNMFQERGDRSRLAAAMGRIGVAGETLSAAGVPEKYTTMMTLVGMYGPEAAQVLDPHVRRAAYRYRGTERTADKSIKSVVEDKAIEQTADVVDEGGMSLRNMAAKFQYKDIANDPVTMSLKVRGERAGGDTMTGDQVRLAVRSDMAALELLKTLPKGKALAATLSRESGHVLPSQGVMIDADGDLISQSVGFADDHYLPFNLANMGRLRGGQYVRTRQEGGLTGEDIYASVMHGARSATVASASGVYRLEFAPDFRGARGNSDKAFAMYDRYLKILDTLRQEKVYQLDLDSATKATIREGVRRANPNITDKQELARLTEAAFDRKRAEKEAVTLKETEDLKRETEKEVAAKYPGASAQQRAGIYNELFDDKYQTLQDSKIRRLNLSAEGYAVALQTLQAQFPYFIRTVEYEPLRGPKDSDPPSNRQEGKGFAAARGGRYAEGPRQSRGKDTGYLRAGQLSLASGGGKVQAKPETPPPPTATPTAAPTSAAAAATTAAAAGAAPAAPQQPAETTSPAARAAAVNGRLEGASARKEMLDDFSANLRRFNNPVPGSPGGPAVLEADERASDYTARTAETYEEVQAKYPLDADGGPRSERKMHALWFLSRPDAKSLDEAFSQNTDAALNIFANASPEELSQVAESLWSRRGLQSLFDESKPFGASSSKELGAELRERAMALVDSDLLSQPFTDHTPENVRQAGARAISYEDITGLENAQAVKEFAQANPELVQAAERIGTHEGQYIRASELSNRMNKAIKALNGVEEASAKFGDPNIDQNERDQIAAKAKTDIQRNVQALGIVDQAVLDSQFSDTPDREGMEALYDNLQRARTFIEVSRAYKALPSAEVGGARPKAGVLKAALSPVAKAALAWAAAPPVWELAAQYRAAQRQSHESMRSSPRSG